MNHNILIALVKGEKLKQELIEEALYDMCDREHSTCNDACLVYLLNNHKPLNSHKPFRENRGCDCFKNGKAIYDYIKGWV